MTYESHTNDIDLSAGDITDIVQELYQTLLTIRKRKIGNKIKVDKLVILFVIIQNKM